MLSAVSLAFFVSGAAGLIFELVWFHRASLVFGNSVWATSLVLSSFMAGLAIGNASVARFATRRGRPLRVYAALEAIVAVTGLAVTAALPAVSAVLVPLTRSVGDMPWLVNFIRFTTAFGVLVVPAAAMGATLPVLTGALTQAEATLGRVLGRLYGWNTLGAVAGVVLAEVVLVAEPRTAAWAGYRRDAADRTRYDVRRPRDTGGRPIREGVQTAARADSSLRRPLQRSELERHSDAEQHVRRGLAVANAASPRAVDQVRRAAGILRIDVTV